MLPAEYVATCFSGCRGGWLDIREQHPGRITNVGVNLRAQLAS